MKWLVTSVCKLLFLTWTTTVCGNTEVKYHEKKLSRSSRRKTGAKHRELGQNFHIGGGKKKRKTVLAFKKHV